MPLQETSGNATTDAYGGGVAAVPNYIESVFSTYLYTGNGSTQTITNGIDLSTKGGLVWIKSRSNAYNNTLIDTARTSSFDLVSNSTAAQAYNYDSNITAFNTTGFSLGNGGVVNNNGPTYASWTFRKQPKFFDVVTYTGTGASSQTISHSLASVPGFIAIKRTDSTGDWVVIARSSSNGQYYCLQNATTPFGFNSTNAAFGTVDFAGMGYLSSTTFLPYVFGGGNSSTSGTNISGATYVAYLFAHNAGGFGLTGTDNVISCGSFTTDASGNATVNLGYEPQWLLYKSVNSVGNWQIADTMRGFNQSVAYRLFPNSTAAEFYAGGSLYPTATGFQGTGIFLSSEPHIYIAIRRGPMKVPTDATKVFSPALYTGTGSTNTITSPFPSDLLLVPNRAGQFYSPSFWDRLRGATKFLRSPGTDAEATSTDGLTSFSAAQNSVAVGADATYGNINFSGRNYVPYFFRRAPSFFDEVCYTGTGSATTFSHNLGVAPELMIVKQRSSAGTVWITYSATLGAGNYLSLNLTSASAADPGNVNWNNTAPTSSVFTVGTGSTVNSSGSTYVAYLFASCTGVSKVGSYTGNGSTQTINCGFTGGARFVLLKATSTTGNWMVYDTARGMTTLTDPFLSLNSTSAETATLGACTTVSTGFSVNESILAGVNTNGVSFVYLAIA